VVRLTSMSMGYAIVYRSRFGEPQLQIVQVVWREEEAVEFVNRLNALASDGSAPYSWEVTWVARPNSSARGSLPPKDRELLDLARKHNALDTERPIGVFSASSSTCRGQR